MKKKPPQYGRGFTAQASHSPETRAPQLQGRAFNPVYAGAPRSVLMSPPTDDTEEPRGRGKSKRLARGRR